MTETIMLTKNTNQLRQQVAAHVAADSIAQGSYWDDPEINEQAYGLPVVVQRIAESIFESLPEVEAKAFFAALPDAMGCDGKDLSKVGWQFLAAELRALPEQPDWVQVVIDPVIAGMDLLASGQEWAAAADAYAVAYAAANAYAAAAAAADAANAAADAADAYAAAAAAADAANAAYDAAYADAYAAARAARAATRRRQRDTLLALISQAPVLEGGE